MNTIAAAVNSGTVSGMSGAAADPDPALMEDERRALLQRTSDAVKAVQKSFAGKQVMATSQDANTQCLCSQLESILCHGLRSARKRGAEVAFWPAVSTILPLEEAHRINMLEHITTDSGRGRAWLRASLNEQCLQKHLRALATAQEALATHYTPGAFLADEERTDMLANLCVGLESTFFALEIDSPEINGVRTASGAPTASSPSSSLSTAISGGSGGGETGAPSSAPTPDETPAAFVAVHEHVAHPSVQVVTKRKKKKKKESKHKRKSSRGLVEIGDLMSAEEGAEKVKRDSAYEPGTIGGSGGGGDEHGSSSNGEGTEGEQFHDAHSGTSSNTLGAPDTTGVATTDTLPISPLATLSVTTTPSLSAELSAAASSGGGGGGGGGDMGADELREVLLGVMKAKDALEADNRELRGELGSRDESIKQLTAASTAAMSAYDELKAQLDGTDAGQSEQVAALTKENTLLKQQLKKYVTENVDLKREVKDAVAAAAAAAAAATAAIATSGEVEEADDVAGGGLEEDVDESYGQFASVEAMQQHHEAQILQLAEMHCELLDLNERLQAQLGNRDALIVQLGGQVPQGGGALPTLGGGGDGSGGGGGKSAAARRAAVLPRPSPARVAPADGAIVIPGSNTIVNIWIPAALLRGKGSDAFHVYQVYVRVGDEEWNVYRRYTHFHDLHRQVQHVFPEGALRLPKKKAIGRKSAKFIETRRVALQEYLRTVMRLCLSQTRSPLVLSPSKRTLCEALPFVREKLGSSMRGGNVGVGSNTYQGL